MSFSKLTNATVFSAVVCLLFACGDGRPLGTDTNNVNIATNDNNINNQNNSNENSNNNSNNNNSPVYLEVQLSDTTPAEAVIPRNVTNADYAKFKFIASEGVSVNVTKLVLTRDGTNGGYQDFREVKVSQNDVIVGGPVLVAQTDKATISDMIVIQTGAAIEIMVKADMFAEEGRENRFCISQAADVEAKNSGTNEGIGVIGNFPVCGNFMATTTFDQGMIHFTQIYPDATEIRIRELDTEFMTVEVLNDSVENAVITRMMFVTDIDPAKIMNHKLTVDGSQVGEWDAATGSFDLSSTPYMLTRGASAQFVFKAELVGGLCEDLWLRFNDAESVAIGMIFGWPLIFTSSGPDQGGPSTKRIAGHGIAFWTSPDTPPADNVHQTTIAYPFLRFTLLAGADSVVDYFGLRFGWLLDHSMMLEINDIKVWTLNSSNDSVVVAGPLDGDSFSCQLGFCSGTFYDQLPLKKCEAKTFTVTADVGWVPVGTQLKVEFARLMLHASDTENGMPFNEMNIFGGLYAPGNFQTVISWNAP